MEQARPTVTVEEVKMGILRHLATTQGKIQELPLPRITIMRWLTLCAI